MYEQLSVVMVRVREEEYLVGKVLHNFSDGKDVNVLKETEAEITSDADNADETQEPKENNMSDLDEIAASTDVD